MKGTVVRVIGISGEDGGVGSVSEWVDNSSSSDRTKGHSSLEGICAFLVIRNLELCLTLLGTERVGFLITILRFLGGFSFTSVGV